jgi:5'-nucleotidase
MKPLILISNDDGYLAKGINALIEMLRPIGDLLVVAPDHQRSAAGCSITTEVPITSKIVRQEEGLTIYSCTGTPAD